MTIKLTDQLVFVAAVQDNTFKATVSDAQTVFAITMADALVYNAQVSDKI